MIAERKLRGSLVLALPRFPPVSPAGTDPPRTNSTRHRGARLRLEDGVHARGIRGILDVDSGVRECPQRIRGRPCVGRRDQRRDIGQGLVRLRRDVAAMHGVLAQNARRAANQQLGPEFGRAREAGRTQAVAPRILERGNLTGILDGDTRGVGGQRVDPQRLAVDAHR